MRIGIVSLFPDMFSSLQFGITGRAITKGAVEINFWNPRDFVSDKAPSAHKRRTVDERPYGGGPGMVMKVQPLQAAIRAAKDIMGHSTRVIHLSPQGKLLTQKQVIKLVMQNDLILVASRYEGVDERLLETEIDEEWSIGDYILTGGELPAMVLVDTMIRMIPGVLGHEDSAYQDSFMDGLLDYPHYTRPCEFEGKRVPKVLLEGHHQAIATWRLKQALGRTWLRRNDLLQHRTLSPNEEKLLTEFIREYHEARGKNDE